MNSKPACTIEWDYLERTWMNQNTDYKPKLSVIQTRCCTPAVPARGELRQEIRMNLKTTGLQSEFEALWDAQ